MGEAFVLVKDTLALGWDFLWTLPLWSHILVTIPVGLFLIFQMSRITISLVGDIVSGGVEKAARIEKKPEKGSMNVEGLIAVAVSTVVGVSLLPAVLEEVDAMPNQLIQKKDKVELNVIDPIAATTIAISEQKLKQGFEKIEFERGLKSLTRLEAEFKGLRGMLGNCRIDETVLNLKRVAKLTDSLYQQGLSFLSQILNVAEQSSASSKEDLLEEGGEIRAALEKSKPESSLYNMLSERLEKNVEAYNIVKSFSEKLDEYFCQVGMCRDSIREIRLGIPELLDNRPKEEYDKVLLELKTRVELAQRVQAEYTKQGI